MIWFVQTNSFLPFPFLFSPFQGKCRNDVQKNIAPRPHCLSNSEHARDIENNGKTATLLPSIGSKDSDNVLGIL